MKLVAATEEQKRERNLHAHAAWGQRLTSEEFRRREDRLRAHPWSRAGMRTWLLCQGPEILASCETFRMESRFDGAPGVTEGVASVFVDEPLRGRGLATRMLSELAARFESERTQASILFSDVGPALYRGAGWVDVPSVDRDYPAVSGDPGDVCDELLSEGEVGPALEALPHREVGFEVRASAIQLDWHLERERCYADILGLPRPPFHGARAGDSLLLLCGNLKDGELVGLVYRASEATGAAAVIEAGRRIAGASGLSRLHIWERGEAQPWPPGGQRLRRSESLAMIRALAPGLGPGM